MTQQAKTFEKYYKIGVWTIDMLKSAVKKKKITAAEFKEITGQDYTK